jgi:hypothetical protein
MKYTLPKSKRYKSPPPVRQIEGDQVSLGNVTKYQKSSHGTHATVPLLTLVQALFSREYWPSDEDRDRLDVEVRWSIGIEDALELARSLVTGWEELFSKRPEVPPSNYDEVKRLLQRLLYQIFEIVRNETIFFPEKHWNELSVLMQQIIIIRNCIFDSWYSPPYEQHQVRLITEALGTVSLPLYIVHLVREYADEKCPDPYDVPRIPDCSLLPAKCCLHCVALVERNRDVIQREKRLPGHGDHSVCFQCVPVDSYSEHSSSDSEDADHRTTKLK